MQQPRGALWVAILVLVVCTPGGLVAQAQAAALRVVVRAESQPVVDAEVSVAGVRQQTGASGVVSVTTTAGRVEVSVAKPGYATVSARADAVGGSRHT